MKIYGTESTRLVVVVNHIIQVDILLHIRNKFNTTPLFLHSKIKSKYSYEHKKINSEIQMQSFFVKIQC